MTTEQTEYKVTYETDHIVIRKGGFTFEEAMANVQHGLTIDEKEGIPYTTTYSITPKGKHAPIYQVTIKR